MYLSHNLRSFARYTCYVSDAILGSTLRAVHKSSVNILGRSPCGSTHLQLEASSLCQDRREKTSDDLSMAGYYDTYRVDQTGSKVSGTDP